MYTKLAGTLVKYWTIRCEVSFFFFFFLTTEKWVQSKFRESKLKLFFIIRRVITTEIINYGFDRAASMLNIISVKMKGFFFFLPEKEKERDENLSAPWNVGLILKRENSSVCFILQ